MINPPLVPEWVFSLPFYKQILWWYFVWVPPMYVLGKFFCFIYKKLKLLTFFFRKIEAQQTLYKSLKEKK